MRWLRADGCGEVRGKRPDLQEEGAPSRPYTRAESCSCLYLAQGPQIVKSAPGPCVQTGKNCCHPSQQPQGQARSRFTPAQRGGWDQCRLSARSLNTCAELITFCRGRYLQSRGERIETLKACACRYLDE